MYVLKHKGEALEARKKKKRGHKRKTEGGRRAVLLWLACEISISGTGSECPFWELSTIDHTPLTTLYLSASFCKRPHIINACIRAGSEQVSIVIPTGTAFLPRLLYGFQHSVNAAISGGVRIAPLAARNKHV